MSKPVLLSIGAGKVQELAGTANADVLTWDSALDGGSWKSAAIPYDLPFELPGTPVLSTPACMVPTSGDVDERLLPQPRRKNVSMTALRRSGRSITALRRLGRDAGPEATGASAAVIIRACRPGRPSSRWVAASLSPPHANGAASS